MVAMLICREWMIPGQVPFQAKEAAESLECLGHARATCQEDYARRQWPLKSSLSKQSDSHRGRRMLVCLSRLVYSVHTFAAHAGKRFYRRATQVSGPLQSNLQGGVQ